MKNPPAPERTLFTYRRLHSLDDSYTSLMMPRTNNNWLVVPPLPGFQPASSLGTSTAAAVVLENTPSVASTAVQRSPSQRVRKAILDRLHQLLPQFLIHLANPTYASASKACSLLIKQKQQALKLSSRYRRMNDSFKKKHQQQQHQQKRASKKTDFGSSRSRFSPPKSPRILQWLSPSAQQQQQQSCNNDNVTNKKKASESALRKQQEEEDDEWERLVVSPFLLLLTAEVWVADLQQHYYYTYYQQEHQQPVDDHQSSLLLIIQGLYQQARQDIWNTQHFLRHLTNKKVDNGDDGDTMITKNKVVYQDLEGVLHWISARCQVLQILECPLVQQQAEAYQVLWEKSRILSLSSSSVEEWGSALQPLIRALQQEVQVYRAACDACHAIQQARFMECITLMRQWKRSLPKQTDISSTTRRDLWLRQSYQHALSLLPMYFDRARAMAGPLYGLKAMNQIVENDLDILVLDFLKRQERLGGPPTAVALVLDAVGTSNLHPERGFCLNAGLEEEKGAAVGESKSKHRVLWPAIYLRSTLHSGMTYHSNTASTTQRSTGTPSSSTNRLSYKSAGSLVRATNRSSATAKNRSTVSSTTILLEYGPDGGAAKSWPHSNWHALVGILDRRKALHRKSELLGASSSHPLLSQITTKKKQREAIPVTYRLSQDSSTGESQLGGGADIAATLFTQPQSLELDSSSVNTDTFHLVAVSEWITLAVIVKKEEGGRWQRKRSQIHDEEIHDFLATMAEQLSVNEFLKSNRPPSQLPTDPLTGELRLPLPKEHDFSWTDDRHVGDFVEDIKVAFGSRPLTSGQVQNTTRAVKRGKPTTESPQEGTPWTVAMTESAAAFFLGSELSRVIGEQSDGRTQT